MSASNVQTKKSKTRNLPSMPSGILKEFMKVLQIQSTSQNESSMVAFLARWLTRNRFNFKMDIHGNMFVVKGKADFYPCVVAHMDTVHAMRQTFNVNVFKKGNREIAMADAGGGKPAGIGGDDKCGIFACLYMLEHFDNIKVVFFSQEEMGCVGSSNADADWFDNVGYIIQLDRWGSSDFICKTYGSDTVSKEFGDTIKQDKEKFGYVDTTGLITDSINLWELGIGKSAVNISCGYYEHHTINEKIDLNEFWNSLLFTEAIIHSLGEKEYPSICKAYSYKDDEYYNDYYPIEDSSRGWVWDNKTKDYIHTSDIKKVTHDELFDSEDDRFIAVDEMFYHSGMTNPTEFYNACKDDSYLNTISDAISNRWMFEDIEDIRKCIYQYCESYYDV